MIWGQFEGGRYDNSIEGPSFLYLLYPRRNLTFMYNILTHYYCYVQTFISNYSTPYTAEVLFEAYILVLSVERENSGLRYTPVHVIYT